MKTINPIEVLRTTLSDVENDISYFEKGPSGMVRKSIDESIKSLRESRANLEKAIDILSKGPYSRLLSDKDFIIAAMEYATTAVIGGCTKSMSDIFEEFTVEVEARYKGIVAAAETIASKYRPLVYPYCGSGMLSGTEDEGVIKANTMKCAIIELEARIRILSNIRPEDARIVSLFSGASVTVAEEIRTMNDIIKYMESCM